MGVTLLFLRLPVLTRPGYFRMVSVVNMYLRHFFQSLASEIEKDFVEQNLTDFASERAMAEPTPKSSSSVPIINVEEHGEG